MIEKRLDAGAAVAFSGRAIGMWSAICGERLLAGDTEPMTVLLRGTRHGETQRLAVLPGEFIPPRGSEARAHSAQTYSPENQRRHGAVGARSRIPTHKR
jgi:hypothetical protein